MTNEELLREIEELRKENDLLRRQLSGQVNEIVTSNADSRDGQLDGDYAENIEDIGDEPIVTSPVVEVSSKSSNSSVSEQKEDDKNFESELRRRLFPWFKKGIPLSAESGISDRDYKDDNGDVGATTSKEDNNSQGEDLSAEKNSVDLSDFTIVDDDTEIENPEEEAVDINKFATTSEEDNNSQGEDLSAEENSVDLSDFTIVDDDTEIENPEEGAVDINKFATTNKKGSNSEEEELSGYFFADNEEFENEEENDKKRRFPFFKKREEKIDYQPKHMRKTKKLERIRESKFFNKIKSALNKKPVKVIAAVLIAPVAIGGIMMVSKLSNDEKNNTPENNVSYAMHDNSEVPSFTVANEYGVSAKDVADAIGKNKEDKKTQLGSSSKTNMVAGKISSSEKQSDDKDTGEIDYDIGDPVRFEGPYLYRTSVDAANDTNRYGHLYPSTDKRVISLIRLVSPDGSEKKTIDANNKEKKEQLEAQGWSVESYNIDNLTNGVTNEGWTPGKSLK